MKTCTHFRAIKKGTPHILACDCQHDWKAKPIPSANTLSHLMILHLMILHLMILHLMILHLMILRMIKVRA
ncbi:hypothetical protein [Plasmodium yoelii yoelii]|uniref:Uncharacterized protein n=1 Tax=Plasmodium yoelii yoelii TaxID=73239 RepID=Q7RBI6_PLAYO|nr:hypothetical protein [Plasmodium yoelii yoelii]